MSALRRGRGEEMTVWMHRAQGEADAMGARHGDGVEDVFVTRRDGGGGGGVNRRRGAPRMKSKSP